MTRDTGLLTVVMLGWLSGCGVGMTALKYQPAQAPQGVLMRVDGGKGEVLGELIEVRDIGIVVLVESKLRLLRYSEIVSAKAEQTSGRYSLSGRKPPKPDVMEHLRMLSRYPQGLTPELLKQLLEAHGQSELAGS